MRYGTMIVVVAAVLAMGVTGHADMIAFREGGGNPDIIEGFVVFNGDNVTDVRDVTFDDTYLKKVVASQGGPDNNYGTATTMVMRSNNWEPWLIMIRDLFTELPATDGGGGTLVIDGAELSVKKWDTGGEVTPHVNTVMRITSNWDNGTAGLSETDVSFAERRMAADLTWSAPDTQWDPDCDTTSVGAYALNWGDNSTESVNVVGGNTKGYGGRYTFDVSTIVADMYDNGSNYGFGFKCTGGATAKTSEDATLTNRPQLIIEYHYEPIPEPGTVLLIGTGVLGVIGYMRRRRMR